MTKGILEAVEKAIVIVPDDARDELFINAVMDLYQWVFPFNVHSVVVT